MKQSEMIDSLRAEIAKLQRVLELLLEGTSEPAPARRPGWPKGSSSGATSFNPEEFAPAKRTMSAEGKARIAAAQKRRWAAQKSAPTKSTSKSALSKPSGKSAPAVAKKNAGAGKRIGSTPAKTQAAPLKRPFVIAKKVAVKKAAAKKATRPATRRPIKQAGVPASEPQTAA